MTRQREQTHSPAGYGAFIEFLSGIGKTVPEGEEITLLEVDEEFKAPEQELTGLTVHLLKNCGTELSRFSDERIGACLGYLFDSGWSSHVLALISQEVSLGLRADVYSSMFYLYRDCLSKRCLPALGHISEPGNTLNYWCYMLWDVSPLQPSDSVIAANDARLASYFDMMRSVLTIDHCACQESALHGLGHCRDRTTAATVTAIIDEFLRARESDTRTRPELLQYAAAAKTGYIN